MQSPQLKQAPGKLHQEAFIILPGILPTQARQEFGNSSEQLCASLLLLGTAARPRASLINIDSGCQKHAWWKAEV